MIDKRDIIKRYLDKWLKPLGLLYWQIDVLYYDDAMEIKRQFKDDAEDITNAQVDSDWRYLRATIKFNLAAMAERTDDDIETTVVHELVHILVCETRTEGIDHEERVVTQLTKAFMWTREADK